MTVPVREAAQGPHPQSILATHQGALALASILINRLVGLGERVVLNQQDFEAIAWTRFMESNETINTGQPDGMALAVWIERPTESGPMQ